jgi:AcrR family transcriptional regulator
MSRLSEKKKVMLKRVTQEILCQAAASILETEGLQGLTMEKLAKTAGVAKGTLYNYFQDKRTIVYSVAERNMKEVLRKLQDLDAEQKSPGSLLEMSLDLILRDMSKNRKIIAAMLQVMSEDPRRELNEGTKKDLVQQIQDKIVEIIRRGTSTGKFIQRDPLLVALIIQGMFRGIVHEFIVRDTDEHDIDEVISIAKGLILRGICLKEENN